MSETKASCTIALAGQPNVGKSTVFNMLTGLNQHVGNWPGKTVEQKTGLYTHDGQVIRLVDLPGTYSLTANSEEERIARDFLLRERPDVVVVIVNAAALERNLYLVAELLSMPVRVVVGLNMTDVAEQEGILVETHVLQAALGAPVVPLVASRNQGVSELIDAALRLIKNPDDFAPNRPEIRPKHRPVLAEIRSLLGGKITLYPEDWTAIKLLEGDTEITEMVRQSAQEAWERIHTLLKQHEDAYLDVAGGRYEWVGRMVRAAVEKPKAGAISLTDRLDKIATHPFWGLALLLGIFGLVFWLTYTAAMPVVSWLGMKVISSIAESVRQVLAPAPAWLTSLLVDGLIGGAGTVLTFVPILIVFFAVLGLLEDVGYLARSAYVMDRFMHWMGLHGRSFLPMCIGFGCNVPGVMCARIVEERRARLLTILLMPLVPCSARMAVIAFLAPAFFGKNAALVSWGLVAGNTLLLLLVGMAINRGVFRGARSAFIMEMPLYHLPNARTIGLYIWYKTGAFIKKAGGIILLASAIVWLLAYLPGGEIEGSLLARFGRWLEPAGQWLGLGDWRLIVALLSSFVAKENTIATLGVLYGSEANLGLAEQVARTLTPAAALAFLVVQMTFIPCAATVAVIKQETASWKWTAFSVGLLLVISFGAAVIIYQLARVMGWGG
ncbi:ferrous iron transport protein B [bacterium]|nr:ferrous iron transport protein B [bacterium]PIW20369.1 MAG: ferrous iron transport protein B [Anaerolineae bacterium CG17_big_fil_post_rev_8_21_14_2_50_57_27]